jgi:quinol monooxygenase YgiN
MASRNGGKHKQPRGKIMAHLIAKHQVKDFGAWQEVYNSLKSTRTEAGELNDQIFRDEQDGTLLTVVQEWKSLDAAKKFMGSSEIKDAMAKAGVVGPPTFQFVNKA